MRTAPLQCPDCGEDVIHTLLNGEFDEDQEDICPGCGELVGVVIDGDDEDEPIVSTKIIGTEKSPSPLTGTGTSPLERCAAYQAYLRGRASMRTEILNIVRDLRDDDQPSSPESVYPEILKRIHSLKLDDL